jgi:hypothetical protein
MGVRIARLTNCPTVQRDHYSRNATQFTEAKLFLPSPHSIAMVNGLRQLCVVSRYWPQILCFEFSGRPAVIRDATRIMSGSNDSHGVETTAPRIT